MLVKEILTQLSLGKSVAERDSRLDSYFIDTYPFHLLVTAERDIIAGDKGAGKTALHNFLLKRFRTVDKLRGTEIINAFNVAGSPIFQQLLSVPEQSEGRYIAFWKTYILSLVGNWLLDNRKLLTSTSYTRVELFLNQNSLKTADITPGNIFKRLLARFPVKQLIPQSADVEVSTIETGFKIKPHVEFSPPAVVQPPNFFGIDYATGLRLLDISLKESGLAIWVALDRLDEAFVGHVGVEIPALRALLRAYLDFQAVDQIKLKLFLRRDLFRKITLGGFVNLTHINAQKIEIYWDDEDLLNLLIARVKDNQEITAQLGLQAIDNEEAFYRIFPLQISQGEKQSFTWKWILSRLRDGNRVVTPRNLIDFMENCKEAQLRSEQRSPRNYEPGQPLIEADAVRKALKNLSVTRVQDTLITEFAELSQHISRFRNKKAEHNVDSICALQGVSLDEGRFLIERLQEIGFLEEIGTSYKVPMLYREGLGITQGKAFDEPTIVSVADDDLL